MKNDLSNLFEKIHEAVVKIQLKEKIELLIKCIPVAHLIGTYGIIEYYEKMYEHFEKSPKDFLFPNREWLQDSLKRLNIDVSEIFDAGANVDHIKREEVIVLFMLLWIHMVIQNPIRIEVIKNPYDLFYIWTKNRVFIARPTETYYLQDGDRRVLDRLGKSYGWFTGVHHFSIGLKGAVEYHYSSPDDITNINGAYNKAQRIPDIDFNDFEIARNTKFVVREMTDMSNKEYKVFLKKFKEKEVMQCYDLSQCFEDILKISDLELDHEVILEAVDVYNRNVYHLNKALLKLKEKLNEEKN